jgi:DNA-directed RNA polymerase specialized sigma subunit
LKDSDGKSPYWLYDEGQDYVLMPKCDLYRETYRTHHNADSADYQVVDRATRCRNPITGVICKRKCATCEKRDERQGLAFVPLYSKDEDGYMESTIPDTSREADVAGSTEHSELLDKLYSVLDELKLIDREVMIRLYGLYGQAVLSKDACASALGISWHTVDRANTRSLTKLRTLMSDYSDYDF